MRAPGSESPSLMHMAYKSIILIPISQVPFFSLILSGLPKFLYTKGLVIGCVSVLWRKPFHVIPSS